MSFLYGISPVTQCLLHGHRKCPKLYLKEGKRSPALQEIYQLAQKAKVKTELVSSHDLGNLVKTKTHQGAILECGDLPTFDLHEFLEQNKDPFLILLDQVEDPQNLGAIIRTAAFLGADAIVTLQKKAAPLTATVSKASAGAMEYFPIIEVGNLSETILFLKNKHYLVAGSTLHSTSIDLQKAQASSPFALVVGNEGNGLRSLTQKRCDLLVHISGSEETESLNVNAATAILIHHFRNALSA